MSTWKHIGLALLAMALLAVIAAVGFVVVMPSQGPGRDARQPMPTPEEARRMAEAQPPPRPVPKPHPSLPQQLRDDPLWRGLDRYGEGPYPSIFDPPEHRTVPPATRALERSSPDWRGIGTYHGPPPAEPPSR